MWKSVGKMALTAFLASFLDHLGRRTAQHLWPEPEPPEKEATEAEEEEGEKAAPEEKKKT